MIAARQLAGNAEDVGVASARLDALFALATDQRDRAEASRRRP
jgi:hypothetical protein